MLMKLRVMSNLNTTRVRPKRHGTSQLQLARGWRINSTQHQIFYFEHEQHVKCVWKYKWLLALNCLDLLWALIVTKNLVCLTLQTSIFYYLYYWYDKVVVRLLDRKSEFVIVENIHCRVTQSDNEVRTPLNTSLIYTQSLRRHELWTPGNLWIIYYIPFNCLIT